MSISDPIADMLTRVRNANSAMHETVDVPSSRLKSCIADILAQEGFIKSYEIIGNEIKKTLRIYLKYVKDDGGKKERVINGLKRISKPGLRMYVGSNEVPRVLGGLGIAIISSNKGIITDRKARKLKVGGEVLAFIW